MAQHARSARRRGSALASHQIEKLVKMADAVPVLTPDVEDTREALHRAARTAGGGVLLPLSQAEVRTLYEMLGRRAANPTCLKVWQRLRQVLANGSQ